MASPGVRWMRARWPWLLGAVLACAALVQRLRLAPSMGDRDSGVYLYVASVILRGGVPYRDVWDHKPPLIYYLDALAVALGRGSLLGLQVVELAALWVSLGLGLVLLRRAFGGRAAVSAMLPLAASVPLLTDANMVEFFALPLQMAALALFVTGVERRQLTRFGYLIGLLGGLALLLRPTLVGLWAALLLGACLSRVAQPRALLGFGLRMAAGGATPAVVAAVYFVGTGAGPEAWDAVVVYNRVYAQADPGSTLTTMLLGLAVTGLSGLSVMSSLAWLSLARRRCQTTLPGPAHLLLVVAWIDLPIEVGLAGVSGRAYMHYFVAWLPCLAVLAAYFAYSLAGDLAPVARRLGRAATGMWLGTLLSSLVLPLSVRPADADAARARSLALSGVADYVARATTPGESVLVWGAEAEVNVAAQRAAPGRFVYQYPLVTAGYTRPELLDEFTRDLVVQPPALIVDVAAGDDHAVPIDSAAGTPIEPAARLVLARYVKVDAFGQMGWPVYAYAGSGVAGS